MKKITILSLAITIVFAFGSLMGQDKGSHWKKGGDYSLSFTDVDFSNWAAGGDNSSTISTFMNLYASYAKNKTTWDNNLALGFGLTNVASKGYHKSEDKIDFASKWGHKATEKLSYASLVTFKSQFTKGYEYIDDQNKNLISDFLAPGYVTFGVGMDYKPFEFLSIYFSPVTSKLTLVSIPELRVKYGVEPDKNMRYEFGGLSKMVFRKDIFKNVTLESKLELFSNYLHNPQNIDVDWQNAFTMKINKYLSSSLLTHLLYDDDIDVNNAVEGKQKAVQFNRIFGIGFMYKF